MQADKVLRQHATASDRTNSHDARVLDLKHLRVYTQGSTDLEHELLGLFRVQMHEQLLAVLGARNAADWQFATHTLKGAARAVGAGEVAETASKLEEMGIAAAAADRARMLARLERDIAMCEKTITIML
jgi:HPt (histidine-containing phosphotransfer) domain-containing protein